MALPYDYLPLGILVPMQEEVEQLLGEIEAPLKKEYAKRTFYEGTLEGRSVILAQSGIGKVAASFTASLLIHHFGVKAILISGVAGGIADSISVGDLIIADHAVQHDMDCSPLFPPFQIPSTGISHYPTDKVLTEKLRMAAVRFLEQDFELLITEDVQKELSIVKPRLHVGLLVSGDQFIGTTEQLFKIMTGLPDALFVEMEGAAVAQICYDSQIPMCTIRTISDKANDQAHVDFNKFLNKAAKIYTAGVVRKFVAHL